MKQLALLTLTLFVFSCSSSADDGGGTDAGGGGGGSSAGNATACASLSCHVASEDLCDDYTMPTATQCADVPGACSKRSGTLAKPSACPAMGFKAKCVMPGPGGYVLRFYGSRGGASDQSFCTTMAMGTWSTTY